MHGAKVIVFRTYADNLFGHLDGVRIFCIQTGYESVGLAGLNHHHTEVVALEHLVVGFVDGVSLALTLFGEHTGIALAAFGLIVVTQIDNLYAVEIEVELFG